MCKQCGNNEYTFSYLEFCKKCPDGGLCINGVLSVKSGYWRINNYSDIIYPCFPNPDSCL